MCTSIREYGMLNIKENLKKTERTPLKNRQTLNNKLYHTTYRFNAHLLHNLMTL